MCERSCDSDVEYTRTDTFIEKACELLARMVWEVTYEDLEGDSTQHYDKMEFINDFRNYMKGN
jgi:ribosomal protein S3AE